MDKHRPSEGTWGGEGRYLASGIKLIRCVFYCVIFILCFDRREKDEGDQHQKEQKKTKSSQKKIVKKSGERKRKRCENVLQGQDLLITGGKFGERFIFTRNQVNPCLCVERDEGHDYLNATCCRAWRPAGGRQAGRSEHRFRL